MEYSANGGTTWTTTFAAVQGVNSVLVRQTDAAGNVGTAAPFVFTLDTVAATITDTTLPTAGTYSSGVTIRVSVKFSKAVYVTGSGATAPYVSLTFGSTVRKAVYESGDGTDTLVFAYTLVAGDKAPNGIVFGTAITNPTGGAILDAAGNSGSRTLKMPSVLPKVVV